MLHERFADALGQAQRGDALAFGEIWRDAHPMLLRYLRVVAGADAEDIASHTWMKVIERLAGFSGDEPGFRRWLVTVARNHHLDVVRRAGRRPETLVDDWQDSGIADRWVSCGADEETQLRMSTDEALRLVASLPAAQAELVMLRVVMGLEVAEVALITGRTAGAVRVAVHRALKDLAAKLQRVDVTHWAGSAFSSRDD